MCSMTKIKIDSGICPFPKPVALVGALVNGLPNFMNIAWMTRIAFTPHIWGFSTREERYTVAGIKEHEAFSVNFPSTDLVTEADYCGIVSGKQVDKSKLFDVFYGDLGNAPMIRKCPLCVELTLHDIVDMAGRAFILGEVQNVYTEDKYLTDGVLDQKKANFLVFTSPANQYWTLADEVGKAFSIGKKLKQ
ncbi:MAG: flavin reductase family protein [Candidatus Thorarchaeota archaeon]|nr:flavin reductase family protein [Candidatus Thorarchaeota archaeon]